MEGSVLESCIQRASFNIVFQVLFRCITFLMNAFVLRYITQDVIGVMNVRLLLLESTVLFLSREAFRRACLSRQLGHTRQQMMNILWITVPICATLSAVFGYIWLHILTPPSALITKHYHIGVLAVCASCIVEMCCEPIYIAAELFLFVGLKVFMDTIHVLVRTVTFVLLVIYKPDGAVIAFSVAQVLSVAVYALGYYVYFYYYIKQKKQNDEKKSRELNALQASDFPFDSMADFLPRKLDDEPFISGNTAILTLSFFTQGAMKQILTEGERYVMTIFSYLTFYEQGVYDIVNNLGSLAARFIFRPIEEAAYFYFSQTVHRDLPVDQQDKKKIEESTVVLYQLLRGLSSFGILVVIFGQSYSRLLLLLYGGEKLTLHPGPLLMQTHCFSILLLAINGITECYAMATMTAKQINSYNYFMVLLTAIFLLVSFGFTSLFGSVGFILANCCNMLFRIIHKLPRNCWLNIGRSS